MKCALGSRHYATGQHKLPISHGLSDNLWVFQDFMENVLDIEAELCQTHTTAIAANNGTSPILQRWREYEKFHEMLCDIMCTT